MKILQVTYTDCGSEAAESALCLHRAFRKIGTGSILLTANKHTREPGVELLPGYWKRLWRRLCGKNPALYNTGLPEIVRSYGANAVILHDISGGVASVEEIGQLPGKLFQLLYSEAVFPDEKEPLFQKKCEAWSKLPMTLVAPTAGIARKAAEAPIFCGMERIRIPRGVDLSIYHPGKKEEIRKELGFRPGVFTVLTNPADDPVVYQTIRELKTLFGTQIHFVNSTPRSRAATVRLYQACDLLLDGSKSTNAPYHILRASACGLPVAGFNTGGMAEAVADGWSGRLAEEADCDSLTAAVCDILENIPYFRDGACEHAAATFADMSIARKYCDHISR